MQYGQRKLQRSMTEIRKSRNGRFARSFTLACVCQCAIECVIQLLGAIGGAPPQGSVRPASHSRALSYSTCLGPRCAAVWTTLPALRRADIPRSPPDRARSAQLVVSRRVDPEPLQNERRNLAAVAFLLARAGCE